MNRCLGLLFALLMFLTGYPVVAQEAPGAAPADPPQIFLDKNPKIIAYQLKRLTNEQLLKLERSANNKKYKPIFEAILSRQGLEKIAREEALAALVKMNASDPVVELLGGIANTTKEDVGTPGELSAMLLAQPADALKARTDKLKEVAATPDSPARPAAFAGLAVAGESAESIWQLATQNNALPALLHGITLIPAPELRAPFYDKIKPLLTQAPDEPTRLAAIEAAGYIPEHEAEIFTQLAEVITKEQGPVRAAAVRAISRIPADTWDPAQVKPLAEAVVKIVQETPADQRTTPDAVATIQLGNDLANALPAEEGAPLKKSLRELGVQVVLIKTIREQMVYDLRYFAVEAGKPVQVVLQNEDNMPHNFVLVLPGAMQEVAIAGGSMSPPTDPQIKPHVPDSDKVLEASFMVQPGAATTLSFTAPEEPGEYPYVCTFPGHWVRMYGVMVVTDDLESWDESPEVPTDPIHRKPFDSQKVDPSQLQVHQH